MVVMGCWGVYFRGQKTDGSKAISKYNDGCIMRLEEKDCFPYSHKLCSKYGL